MSIADRDESAPAAPPARPRGQRHRVFKAGLVCYNARHSTLPCIVKDMSAGGARISVSGSVGVPDTFELHVELDAIWVGCEVTWRRGDMVGVKFVTPIVTGAPKRVQVVNAPALSAKPSLRRIPKPG